MSTSAYLGGAALFLPTLACNLLAAAIVTRKRLGYLAGAPRLLGFATLATAFVVLAHVLPAALGVLTRGTPLVAAALVLIGALSLRGRAPFDRDPAPWVPTSGVPSILIAVAASGALLVYVLARLRGLIGTPITDVDMLGFHLPGVARWIQTGSVWHVDQFLPGFATAQYPNNGDFLILSTVLPWHDLAFARIPGLVFYALTGIAAYALALELGASRAAAVTFVAAGLAVPPVATFALDGIPDDITLATLAIGVLFLVRHVRTGRTGELVIAGLALGLALGTKWFGLTACAVVIPVWIVGRLVARVGYARVVKDAAIVLAMMASGGGFWLVRNLVESGNPLYPKAISIFGVQLFAGSHKDVVDRFGYTILNYIGQPHILHKYIYAGFKSQLGIEGLVLVGGVVIALLASRVLPRLRRLRAPAGTTGPLFALALVTLGIFVTYVITPGTAYGPKNRPVEAFVTVRWLTPVVILGSALCAAAAARLGRFAVIFELAALAAVIDGIRLGPSAGSGTAIKALLVLLAIVVLFGLARRWTSGRKFSFAGGAALAASLLAAVLIVGRLDQRHYDKQGYGIYDPVYGWIETHVPSGHRVGLTGGTGSEGLPPVLPAFGPRLGNQVTYVGDVVVHSVEVPSQQSHFEAELRRARDDLLLIGLPSARQTETWARALGFRLLARSSRVALYSIPPQALS